MAYQSFAAESDSCEEQYALAPEAETSSDNGFVTPIAESVASLILQSNIDA